MAAVRSRMIGIHALAWLVVVVVFTPVLIELGRHVAANPWTWYALAFPPLTAVAIVSGPASRRNVNAAIALVSIGAAIEFWALASGVVRLGRVGFLLSVVAILVLQGKARPRIMPLLGLCVPIPNSLLHSLADPLLFVPARMLAALARRSGTPALATGNNIDLPSSVFRLAETDAGWTTAALAFGLTWFAGIMLEWSPGRSLVLAAASAILCAIGHVLLTVFLFDGAGLGRDLDQVADLRTMRDLLAYTLTSIAVGGYTLRSRLRAA